MGWSKSKELEEVTKLLLMPTPHIEAKPGQYHETVLMPGDPLREPKWIAENFLENRVLVNTVRNCYGYSGFYKGKMVSVHPVGWVKQVLESMSMNSMSIML